MGLLEHLIAGIVHLMFVVVDIFAVFMLARLAHLIWARNWLRSVDLVGRPMTDWLLGLTHRASNRLWRRKLNERQQIAFALLVLLGIRICVSGLFCG